MAKLHRLAPHDALPGDRTPHVLVLRRFGEDDPHVTLTEITVTHVPDPRAPARTGVAVHSDGRPMSFEEAIAAAARIAAEEHIETVFAIDRTAGPREREILARHGDHSVGDAPLADDDLEEGERGPDMRDRPTGSFER
jgi:hypothetical protein